ncbi:MAG: FG-GAP-like repeat-containing protein, partial [Flammeovirgaceae bacterium]
NKVYISSVTDIDGDGKPDLGITNRNLSTFLVLKNNNAPGSINASSFGAAVSFDTGAGQLGDSGVRGDIDGDGKPDVVAINLTTNTISILRNQLATLPPTISSFTPISGAVGTSVTINGTNFNAVAANNTVYFGAVKALVTAASATQLTVTVPVGATFQPISVLANGLAGTSSKPFLVTFASNGVINTSSFASKVDIATSGQLYGVSLGDLDGDGKSDLAVSNFGGATVSVLRNNTTSSVITTGSFTNADLVSGAGPYGVAIGDLDLDGKLDLAVANWNANTVSLYRNKSTSGSLTAASFTTKADLPLATGARPAALAIGDLDGDGKPDLIVANSGSGFN